MEKEKPKRDQPISYRPPKGRRAEFERLVDQSGLSVNAFINEAVFGRSRHRPGEYKRLAQILGACARIADELHEIRLSGAQNSALVLESLCEELVHIRTLLMERLGRRS